MSFTDFSNRDVNNGIDRMYDYNNDGKIDPNEQVNVNRFYDHQAKTCGHSGFSAGQIRPVIGAIMIVLCIISVIVGIVNYAIEQSEEREEDRKEEIWESAQTVHYFFDDGTESDPENSKDDKYGVSYDPYYSWEYD